MNGGCSVRLLHSGPNFLQSGYTYITIYWINLYQLDNQGHNPKTATRLVAQNPGDFTE